MEDNTVNEHEIWNTLSKINCNEHTEVKKIPLKDKDGRKTGEFLYLTYLSWAWAWEKLMENYPESTYWMEDAIESPPGSKTWMVKCGVGVGTLTKTMWLPVMDNKNASLTNPTSRDVSDTSMRCLVKCIAMFGLGHYIYAGEDLPKDVEINEQSTGKPAQPQQRSRTKVKDSDTQEGRASADSPPDKSSPVVYDDPIYVAMMAFVEGVDSKEALSRMWTDSKDALVTMKNNNEDMYGEVQAAFLNKRNELNG